MNADVLREQDAPEAIPDPTTDLLESYRHLVDALLTHTPLNGETPHLAIEDYCANPTEMDFGADLLKRLLQAQNAFEVGVL
jgi:hypothetical protein